MIALFLIPVILAVAAYLYSWLIRWLSAISPFFRKKPVMIVIAAIMFLCTVSIYAAYPMRPVGFGRFLRQFGYYWIAICAYAAMVILVADLIRVILRRIRKKKGLGMFPRSVRIAAGIVCIAIMAGALTYGFINARVVRTTTYDIDIDKSAGKFTDLNVVLIADLHMGINVGCSHIQDMVDAVNVLEPDLIVVAGDIFDNEYEALEDDEKLISILGSMRAKYGVYCVYGNHDIDEKLLCGFTFNFHSEKAASEEMDSFIERCGWIRLKDEGVMLADSIYLFGRPDHSKPGKDVDVIKTPSEITDGLDPDTPVIILEHEPVDLDGLADAGADLEMAGHTHAGQFFPMNITNNIVWENGYGYLNKNGMHSIVTSGVGVFGPYLRVCTISEIAQIRIHFTK